MTPTSDPTSTAPTFAPTNAPTTVPTCETAYVAIDSGSRCQYGEEIHDATTCTFGAAALNHYFEESIAKLDRPYGCSLHKNGHVYFNNLTSDVQHRNHNSICRVCATNKPTSKPTDPPTIAPIAYSDKLDSDGDEMGASLTVAFGASATSCCILLIVCAVGKRWQNGQGQKEKPSQARSLERDLECCAPHSESQRQADGDPCDFYNAPERSGDSRLVILSSQCPSRRVMTHQVLQESDIIDQTPAAWKLRLRPLKIHLEPEGSPKNSPTGSMAGGSPSAAFGALFAPVQRGHRTEPGLGDSPAGSPASAIAKLYHLH